MRKTGVHFVLGLFLLFVAGCAGFGSIPVSYPGPAKDFYWPEPGLKEAFLRYWTLRSKGDYEKTLKLEAPYLQEIVPMALYKNYVAPERTKITGVNLSHVQREEDNHYYVAMNLSVMKEGKEEKKVSLRDEWVKAADRWYHVIKDPVMRKYFP
jgi:hypothetical protein